MFGIIISPKNYWLDKNCPKINGLVVLTLVFFESSLKKLKKEKKVIPLKYWRLKRKIFG